MIQALSVWNKQKNLIKWQSSHDELLCVGPVGVQTDLSTWTWKVYSTVPSLVLNAGGSESCDPFSESRSMRIRSEGEIYDDNFSNLLKVKKNEGNATSFTPSPAIWVALAVPENSGSGSTITSIHGTTTNSKLCKKTCYTCSCRREVVYFKLLGRWRAQPPGRTWLCPYIVFKLISGTIRKCAKHVKCSDNIPIHKKMEHSCGPFSTRWTAFTHHESISSKYKP